MKRISVILIPNWLTVLIYTLLVGCMIMVHVRLYPYAFDDAYIHFRVARNLVENGNPNYNIHEAIKVSTSSGWIVFLAIIFGIAHLLKADNHFPLVISITNLLISLYGMYIYTKIMEKLLGKQLSFPMKLMFQISYLAVLLLSSIGLMETPFALLIAGLGIYWLCLSKPSGFALLGFAAYIRLELSILMALAVLFYVFKQGFRLTHIIGYIALGSIPLLIYDLYFFHTFIPHSIGAKSIVYTIGYLRTVILILFFSLPALPLGNILIAACIGILMLSTIVITTLMVLREREVSRVFWSTLFCLWSLLIMGGYILGHTPIFTWYSPLYMIPLLVACFLCSNLTPYPKNIIVKSLFGGILLISAFSITRSFYASTKDPSAFDQFEPGSRVKVYRFIGSILYDEYPNATLLTSEIGGLGYAFKGEILDAAGLASTDALDFHPMKIPEERSDGGLGAIPPGYVKLTQPDIIVSYDFLAQALIHDEVIGQYNLILLPAYLPEDAAYSKKDTLWDSKYCRVYIRKDLPITEKMRALER
jgi:hypothetical protein